jgi:hypothetical protein
MRTPAKVPVQEKYKYTAVLLVAEDDVTMFEILDGGVLEITEPKSTPVVVVKPVVIAVEAPDVNAEKISPKSLPPYAALVKPVFTVPGWD